METDTIVALLGGGGIAAIISAVVAGLFSKRKLGAEAAEIITKAAAGVVTNMQAEIDRQVQAREHQSIEHHRAMATLMANQDHERGEWRRVLQLHVAWDVLAIAKLNDLGFEMPPAPPLLPPRPLEHIDLPDLPTGGV